MKRSKKNPPDQIRCPYGDRMLPNNFNNFYAHLHFEHNVSRSTAERLWDIYKSGIKNPRPILKQRYYRHAVQAAKWLYTHFKGHGVPSYVIERISPKIRPIVVDILNYNGVPIRHSNPPKGAFK